jgi:hypothetical protein
VPREVLQIARSRVQLPAAGSVSDHKPKDIRQSRVRSEGSCPLLRRLAPSNRTLCALDAQHAQKHVEEHEEGTERGTPKIRTRRDFRTGRNLRIANEGTKDSNMVQSTNKILTKNSSQMVETRDAKPTIERFTKSANPPSAQDIIAVQR